MEHTFEMLVMMITLIIVTTINGVVFDKCGYLRSFTHWIYSCDSKNNSIFNCSTINLKHLKKTLLPKVSDASHNIQELSFKNCCLEIIDEDAFSNIVNVARLDLSYNSLRVLESRILTSAEKLSHLDISSNKLKRLPFLIFNTTKNLTYLDMSSNELDTLDYQLFHGLEKLLYLNIRSNDLHPLIDSQLFMYQTKLLSLFLGNNSKMTTVDDGVLKPLSNIRKLDLAGINFKCDCRLKLTFIWCSNKSIETNADCFYPSEFRGRPWNILNSSLPCKTSVPNIHNVSREETNEGKQSNFHLSLIVIVCVLIVVLLAGIFIAVFAFYCKKSGRSIFKASMKHSTVRKSEEYYETVSTFADNNQNNTSSNEPPAVPFRGATKNIEIIYDYACTSITTQQNTVEEAKSNSEEIEISKKNYSYG